MAWQDEMVPMLRVLIWDLETPAKFSDERLEEVILVASRYVGQEIVLPTTYTINFSALSLSPDPTDSSTKDETFINFALLKSACICDQGNFRTQALKEGINVRLGPAAIAVANRLVGFRQLIEFGPCAAYETLKKEYNFGNASAIISTVNAVIGPFISNKFDPGVGLYPPDERIYNG